MTARAVTARGMSARVVAGGVLAAGVLVLIGCLAGCAGSGPAAAPAASVTQVAAGQDGEPAAAAEARTLADQTAFVPTRLVLPSGRSAPVLPAGLAADDTLAVPADPGQVGWWTGGARPGDPYGTVVVAGHIDSRRYGLGVLAEAATVTPGRLVRLTAGTRTRTYRVVSVRQVPKARLAAGTDTFAQTGPARLALVTCGGRFDPQTHRYADNVVVLAVPVG